MLNISHNISAMKPVIDEKSFQQHYAIYLDHITKFDNAQDDIVFHKAGKFLHEQYFQNIREYRADNLPTGRTANVLQMRYGNWDNFVKTYLDTVHRLQGSGWIFMNTAGYLNIIPNNRIVEGIGFIIDFWEHAYYSNFGSDKDAYAIEHLGLINWDMVNQRIIDYKKKKNEN